MSLFGPSKKELAALILQLETELRIERNANATTRTDLRGALRQIRELQEQLKQANTALAAKLPEGTKVTTQATVSAAPARPDWQAKGGQPLPKRNDWPTSPRPRGARALPAVARIGVPQRVLHLEQQLQLSQLLQQLRRRR